MSMNVPNDSTRNRCETCGSGGYRKATRACRAVGNARRVRLPSAWSPSRSPRLTSRDGQRFEERHLDTLTTICNACHEAEQVGFMTVAPPSVRLSPVRFGAAAGGQPDRATAVTFVQRTLRVAPTARPSSRLPQIARSAPHARSTWASSASEPFAFGTRVPGWSRNSDSPGFSRVSPWPTSCVIATESYETRRSEAGSIPTASTN